MRLPPQGCLRRFVVRTEDYRNKDFLFTDDEYIARVTKMLAEEAMPNSRFRNGGNNKSDNDYYSLGYDEVPDRY
jgi:hypothetical protein